MKEIIERIRKCKKVGVITDSRLEGQKTRIKDLGLDEVIGYIIITNELSGTEFGKPARLRLSRGRKRRMCIRENAYIGNNIKKDFIAPEKLGMRSIWFKNCDGLYWC